MSVAKQNKSIATLIVGAMSIDGSLGKKERGKVIQTLEKIGMSELIADVGAVIEEGVQDVNLFKECRTLSESLGSNADEISPIIFRIIADVVAHDRFVSEREAAYLWAMAKRLDLSTEGAQKIFIEVLAERRSRLETAGSQIDNVINPQLKKFLTFSGADDLTGEVDAESLDEIVHNAAEELTSGQETVSLDDFSRAMTILGLNSNAKLEDAEEVWKEVIDNLNLPKMATLGETFVSAAIARITRINNAYKTILHFHDRAFQRVPNAK